VDVTCARPGLLGLGKTLVLHSGGESRRLPAHAATGKLLMPIPVFRWVFGLARWQEAKGALQRLKALEARCLLCPR